MSTIDEKAIRISTGAGVLMVGTAGLYDVLQILLNLIPYAGQALASVVTLCAFLTFNVLWFHIIGIGFFESLIGKGGRALIRGGLSLVLETASMGAFPAITVWIILTIIQTRLDDEMVSKGIITREELGQIDHSVKQLYRRHGADSPEFRQALATSLGKQIEHRLNQTIDNKRARLISVSRASRVLNNAIADQEYSQRVSSAGQKNKNFSPKSSPTSPQHDNRAGKIGQYLKNQRKEGDASISSNNESLAIDRDTLISARNRHQVN